MCTTIAARHTRSHDFPYRVPCIRTRKHAKHLTAVPAGCSCSTEWCRLLSILCFPAHFASPSCSMKQSMETMAGQDTRICQCGQLLGPSCDTWSLNRALQGAYTGSSLAQRCSPPSALTICAVAYAKQQSSLGPLQSTPPSRAISKAPSVSSQMELLLLLVVLRADGLSLLLLLASERSPSSCKHRAEVLKHFSLLSALAREYFTSSRMVQFLCS